MAAAASPMALLPDARFRSPTAVDGKADMRDENIYSSVLLQHGGGGSTTIFSNPQGQSIPNLAGAGINSPPTGTGTNHQSKYTLLTTNYKKAGEFGSSLGDGSIRGVSCIIEQAKFTNTTGALSNFGASQFETAEILSKTFLQILIAGKKQIEGPIILFPAVGGSSGSVSTTGNAQTVSVVNNGLASYMSLRRLKMPVLVARSDTTECLVGVAGSDSYVFSTTTGDGQPTLLWVDFLVLLKGDVR